MEKVATNHTLALVEFTSVGTKLGTSNGIDQKEKSKIYDEDEDD